MKRRDFLNRTSQAALLSGAATMARETEAEKTMTVAMLGDCLLARRVSPIRHPEFTALVDLLRGVDCTWANGEMLFITPGRHAPGHKGLDPHVSCDPWGAEELAWMGIDFVGLANNHIMDFSETGMHENLSNYNKAGIAFAGVGADLTRAAMPGYMDSPNGRVAQVSFASTFPDWFAAAPANAHVKGRPGLNPLHVDMGYSIDKTIFDGMAAARKEVLRQMGLGMFLELMQRDEDEGPKRLPMGNMWIQEGKTVEIMEVPRQADVDRIVQSISIARGNARVVLAAVHSHESRNSQEEPSAFMQPVARKCIDAGADAYIGTGPHRLRGIEIYKGKPIFYSLGNFLFQYESITAIPAESYVAMGMDPNTLDSGPFYERIPYRNYRSYWESVVPVMHCNREQPVRLELYPITMGFGLARHERGTPVMAAGVDAERIIKELAELSEPYGTHIRMEGGIGHIDLTGIPS